MIWMGDRVRLDKHKRVPLARRQIQHEPLKLALALIGVAVSVALVGLLFGLREGIGRQVTTYEDNVNVDIYVAQGETRNSYSSGSSVLTATVGRKLRKVPGVAEVAPITNYLAILRLHDKRIATMLVGSDPKKAGGPWKMASGRSPRGSDEIAVDNVLAGSHELKIGQTVHLRGRALRVVGFTDRTASWMTPLLFTSRKTANKLQRRGDLASFFLVRAKDRSSESTNKLVLRLKRRFPGLSVLTRERIAANNRALMSETFNTPLLVMVFIALTVGALVIGITIYSFVSERRREFGSMKAIGVGNGRLYRQVTSQALMIAIIGLGAGVAMQKITSALIHSNWPKFLFVSQGSHYTMMVVAALVMAVAGALVPVRVLARLDPLEVFRR